MGVLQRVGILTGLAIVSTGVARAGETVTLSPRFEEGSIATYRHQFHVDQTRMIPLIGDTRRLAAKLERDIRLETLEALPDGHARVRMTIDRVSMVVTPPEGAPFAFDSAASADALPTSARARALAAFAGGSVDVLMAPDGEMISIEAIRAYGAGAASSREAREIDAFFDDVWIRAVMELLYRPSADTPLRSIGDEWATTMRERVGGVADNEIQIAWRLESADEGIARVVGDGEIIQEPKGAIQFEGAPVALKKSVLGYRLDWDLNRGSLERYETDQAVSVEFNTQMNVQAQSVVASSVRLWRIDERSSPAGGMPIENDR